MVFGRIYSHTESIVMKSNPLGVNEIQNQQHRGVGLTKMGEGAVVGIGKTLILLW